MAVVVTGTSGFIGRSLVDRLTGDGHDVVAIDRRPTPLGNRVTPVLGDLAVRDADVDHALRTAVAVFHLAGRPGVRSAGPDTARRRWRDNVFATERVLAVTPLSVPVVVASSSSVYGGARVVDGALRPSHESDALHPRGGHARSKALLEVANARRAAAGGRVAVVRPSTVVGEGQRSDMAMARWIAAAAAGRCLKVYGDGARRRDFTAVDDVVEGLVRIWERGIDATLNLGTGRAVRLDHVIAHIAGALGIEVATRTVPVSGEDVADTLADTRRCEALLGFRPTTDLAAIVARQLPSAALAVGASA